MSRTDDYDDPPILEALEQEANEAYRRVDRMLEEMISAEDLARLDALLELPRSDHPHRGAIHKRLEPAVRPQTGLE